MPLDHATILRAPTSATRLTVSRGLRDLASLERPWISLEGRLGTPDFFQSFAWSMRVAELRLAHDGEGYEPLAAVLRRQETIVAIWPLSRQRRTSQWELRSIDDPFGQIAGVIAARNDDVVELVRMTLDIARREIWADCARFEKVEQTTALAHALSTAGFNVRNSVEAPVVDYEPHESFAALRQSRNKKTMKNLRNRINRAERTGTLASTCAADEQAATAIAQRTLANRESWLAATGKTAPAFRVGGFDTLLTATDTWGLSAKRLALELTLDGKPIAQQIGYRHAGRYYAYVSGMDWAFEALGPGQLHLARVLDDTMALGLASAELLTPASDYKMVWTDQTRQLADMALGLTLSGRLKQYIWDDRIRPALKWIYYRQPTFVRRRLAPRHRPPSTT